MLLLTAAVLKGHELLTVPVANKDLFSWRPFLIFQVEFELAMAIWLLSGVFKRLAWLAALACFCLFCCVTLYKGLTGAASCGCFGRVHVNPWITLLAVDLPSVLSLALCRPERHDDIIIASRMRVVVSLLSFLIVGVGGGSLLALFKPAYGLPAGGNTTIHRYMLLDPESWIGKPFALADYIDIGSGLKTGRWLLILHRQGCRECQKLVSCRRDIATEVIQFDARLAFIAIPPYGKEIDEDNSMYSLGRLSPDRKWIVTTPAIVVLNEGRVVFSVEGKEPSMETVFARLRLTHVVNSRAVGSTNRFGVVAREMK